MARITLNQLAQNQQSLETRVDKGFAQVDGRFEKVETTLTEVRDYVVSQKALSGKPANDRTDLIKIIAQLAVVIAALVGASQL